MAGGEAGMCGDQATACQCVYKVNKVTSRIEAGWTVEPNMGLEFPNGAQRTLETSFGAGVQFDAGS